MKIRPATTNDLPRILEIAEQARLKMRQSGNPTQWGDAYPQSEDIAKDMAMNASFVCLEAERVVAYFAFMSGPDPTYQVIENGHWEHSETPYHVLHRVMSGMGVHGVFATIFHIVAHLQHIFGSTPMPTTAPCATAWKSTALHIVAPSMFTTIRPVWHING